jgi:hypothetical protein
MRSTRRSTRKGGVVYTLRSALCSDGVGCLSVSVEDLGISWRLDAVGVRTTVPTARVMTQTDRNTFLPALPVVP